MEAIAYCVLVFIALFIAALLWSYFGQSMRETKQPSQRDPEALRNRSISFRR